MYLPRAGRLVNAVTYLRGASAAILGRAGTGARPYMANPNVTVCKTHYFIPARKLEALGLVGSWPRRLLVRGQRRAKTVVILAVVEG